jgi:hypothetical protein
MGQKLLVEKPKAKHAKQDVLTLTCLPTTWQTLTALHFSMSMMSPTYNIYYIGTKHLAVPEEASRTLLKPIACTPYRIICNTPVVLSHIQVRTNY